MTDIPEDPELIAILPIEASESGRNTVYKFCEAIGQSSSYAVCLNRMKLVAAGKIPDDEYIDCKRAIRNDNCQAKKMRAEEVSAGHALYYVQRVEYKPEPKTVAKDGAVSSGKYDMSNASYARGWAIGGRDGYTAESVVRNKPRPRPAPPVKKTGFVQENMADLVNVLMKENANNATVAVKAQLEKPTQTASSPSRPMPGESTADFIKRRAAERNAK